MRRASGWILTLSLMLALAACGEAGSPGDASTMEGAGAVESDSRSGDRGCEALPSADELREFLVAAPRMGQVGGLFNGQYEWAALADRSGRICAVVVSADTVSIAWPGSQSIAVAKAYTANAFSTDKSPLSTARLYTLSQPGYSLWGAGAGNPFNPECLVTPGQAGAQVGKLCGGTIAFGGGLPLYAGGKVVGGLGVSGDTPCADHEVAKRIRQQAELVPPGGNSADDIIYVSADSASIYAHPLCPNTWRNGQRIGDESPARQYPDFAQ